MNDGKVDKIIAANMDLANAVGARGTPLYIIGDKLFPGAMQYDQMKDAVAEARKATAK
jgi:protein-disulfide isomerase